MKNLTIEGLEKYRTHVFEELEKLEDISDLEKGTYLLLVTR